MRKIFINDCEELRQLIDYDDKNIASLSISLLVKISTPESL